MTSFTSGVSQIDQWGMIGSNFGERLRAAFWERGKGRRLLLVLFGRVQQFRLFQGLLK